MRVALLAVLVLCTVTLGIAPARAQTVVVNGTLAGDAMPDGYHYELSVVAVRDADHGGVGNVVFEVVGKSCSLAANSHASNSPASSPLASNGVLSCQRNTIVFAPPAGSMSVVNRKAFYKHENKQVYIGDVATLGHAMWVNLRRGAKLEATTTAARVTLDLSILGTGTLSREDRFVTLHARTR